MTSKFDREQQQVTAAIATLPVLFRLRAFPKLECRPNRFASFVLNGSVQVVVDCRPLGTDKPWEQMGRDDIATVVRNATAL